MAFRSSRARGRISISSIGVAYANLLARLRQHVLDDERHGLAAVLPVNERLAQRRDLLLVLFQKPHRGADDFALGFEAPGLDLPGDEAFEVLAQGDARVSRHGQNSAWSVLDTNTTPTSRVSASRLGEGPDAAIHPRFSSQVVNPPATSAVRG